MQSRQEAASANVDEDQVKPVARRQSHRHLVLKRELHHRIVRDLAHHDVRQNCVAERKDRLGELVFSFGFEVPKITELGQRMRQGRYRGLGIPVAWESS